MNLQHQIKTYRNSLNISQEELADKVYVARQTISNWETGKSYPDIHSLLLLSNFFGITLDELVEGDLEMMKKNIESGEIKKFERMSRVFTMLFIVMIVSVVPLVYFFNKIPGMLIWAAIAAITMFVAIKVEKFKKENDVQTYKEIVAFMNGETLDNISKAKEVGKRGYQKFLLALGSAIVTIIVALLIIWILEFM